ncbi:CLMP protein, partial [Polypterus senegalus]
MGAGGLAGIKGTSDSSSVRVGVADSKFRAGRSQKPFFFSVFLDVRGVGVIVGAVVGVGFGVFLMVLIIWLIVRKKEKKKYEEEDIPNEIREDAEAPKAKLMKPNSSSSSRSGSSRSGASSTQSMVHSSAPRSGHRPRVSATLKENGESPTYTAQGLPSYTQVINKELEIEAEPDHNKAHQGSLVRKGVTPAHSRPFETV